MSHSYFSDECRESEIYLISSFKIYSWLVRVKIFLEKLASFSPGDAYDDGCDLCHCRASTILWPYKDCHSHLVLAWAGSSPGTWSKQQPGCYLDKVASWVAQLLNRLIPFPSVWSCGVMDLWWIILISNRVAAKMRGRGFGEEAVNDRWCWWWPLRPCQHLVLVTCK